MFAFRLEKQPSCFCWATCPLTSLVATKRGPSAKLTSCALLRAVRQHLNRTLARSSRPDTLELRRPPGATWLKCRHSRVQAVRNTRILRPMHGSFTKGLAEGTPSHGLMFTNAVLSGGHFTSPRLDLDEFQARTCQDASSNLTTSRLQLDKFQARTWHAPGANVTSSRLELDKRQPRT